MRTVLLVGVLAVANLARPASGQVASDPGYPQYVRAFRACGEKYAPIDARVGEVAYMQCIIAAEQFLHWPYRDLYASKVRARLVIAEKIQAGLITETEGLAEIARIQADISGAASIRRRALRR